MDRWVGRVAIVTGASTGIGEAVSDALVRLGLKVVGVARRVKKLKDLASRLNGAKGAFYPLQCDLMKEGDILEAFRWTEETLGGVDILVNNAGTIHMEPMFDCSTEVYRNILGLNVLAVAICTREAVRSMKKRGAQGHIININSMIGLNAEIIKSPVSLYGASKYAMTGMAESLRNDIEAAEIDIKVTSIHPGLTKTPIFEGTSLANIFDYAPFLLPEDIVSSVVYVLSTPPHVRVNTLTITAHQTFKHCPPKEDN